MFIAGVAGGFGINLFDNSLAIQSPYGCILGLAVGILVVTLPIAERKSVDTDEPMSANKP
jgi:F0F1-type ATP synthase assembly protein I